MKPVDLKSSANIVFDKENDKEYPKFVIMLEYRNIKKHF